MGNLTSKRDKRRGKSKGRYLGQEGHKAATVKWGQDTPQQHLMAVSSRRTASNTVCAPYAHSRPLEGPTAGASCLGSGQMDGGECV